MDTIAVFFNGVDLQLMKSDNWKDVDVSNLEETTEIKNGVVTVPLSYDDGKTWPKVAKITFNKYGTIIKQQLIANTKQNTTPRAK